MKTIKLTHRQIKRAIDKARKSNDNWQSELIEILLLPKIYKHWQALNLLRFRYCYHVERWPGQTAKNLPNKMSDYRNISGYIMTGWNSARPDYYSHSANTCWDGIRRETVHRFLEVLRDIGYGYQPTDDEKHILDCAKIQIITN